MIQLRFLGSTIQPMTNSAWLARTEEQAIESDLIICDPHHHLWQFPTNTYLVKELLADFEGGHRIEKTVYVECQQKYHSQGPQALRPVGETEFVEQITPNHQQPAIAAGIVGFADFTLGSEVQAVIESHLNASKRLRGFRYCSAWHESDKINNSHSNPSKDLLQDSQFRAGLKCLQNFNLPFDSWLYFEQIPQLTALAQALPKLHIVLDHIGGPIGIGPYANKRKEVFTVWQQNIIALASCPNVCVKLSGLTMTMAGFAWHKREVPPASTELAAAMAPYYQHCIEHFGAERCMFASNFAVDRASCSYTVLWNAFKLLSQDYSSSERAALFHDTASRVYKI